MAGPLAKYAFINAKLRARISQILPDDLFVQCAKAPSVEAVLAMLRDTPFSSLEEIYSSTGDLKQAELALLKSEIDLYKNVRNSMPQDAAAPVEALLVRFETDNLKHAIRLFFDRTIRHRSIERGRHYVLYEQILHDIPIDVIVNAKHFDEIAGVCGHTPYEPIIRKFGPTVESDKSLFRLEIGLDHYYYENLLVSIQRLSDQDRKVALRLIGVEIDLQNISWIIRFKEFQEMSLDVLINTLIPGGFSVDRPVIDDLYRAQNVTSALSDFLKDQYPGLSTLLSAKTSDSASRLLLINRVLEEVRKQEIHHILSGYPFTIGILLAYFLLKHDELRKIDMVLNAKHFGKDAERIESLL